MEMRIFLGYDAWIMFNRWRVESCDRRVIVLIEIHFSEIIGC